MTAPLVVSNQPVTLAGGGPFDAAALAQARARAPRLVAADAGAARLADLGATPEAVIGDLDSVPPDILAALPEGAVHEVAEQDSTDFEKCLIRIAAPLVLAVGFAGGRIDHGLAVLSALARHPARRCVVLGPRDAVTLAPPALALDLAADTRLSLFPLGPVTGQDTGLRWPIAGIAFDPLGRTGTSNRAAGPVRLGFSAPRMLLIVPLERLDALMDGLADAPVWPG